MMRRTLLQAGLAALLGATLSFAAHAAYPERPIKFIVPFAAGGSTDMVGRLVAEKLSVDLGQSVIVENKPGAGTTIGTNAVVKAKPDGYTLLLCSSSLVLNRLLYKQLPYDYTKDLVPVAGLIKIPHILVVNPSVPVHSLPELIAYAKRHPGTMNYASTGIGALPHVMAELFLSMTHLKIQHVPYSGTAPALQDLLAGRVQMLFDNLSTALPNLQAGKVRAIGLTTAQRSPAAPQYPTLAEQGLTGYDATSWFGVAAPAGTPDSVVEKVNAAINRILVSPDFQKRIAVFGGQSFGGSSQEFASFEQEDLMRWSRVFHDAHIEQIN